MSSSLSSDVLSKLVGSSGYVVDFYDDFTAGDPHSFTTGRMPTYGHHAWIITGPGYTQPVVGGADGYTSSVVAGSPFYAVMETGSGQVPVEVGATFVWTGTGTLPTVAIFKDYKLGYDEMWHANLYGTSLDEVWLAPGYWHDGQVNVRPEAESAVWTATGEGHGALVAGEQYTVRIHLGDLPNLIETIEDATGTVIASLHVYEPNLPTVLGPWVFFEGGGTDLSWRSAWALADTPSGADQSSTTPSSLTVRVSEDAYGGDAQFVVLVDGVQLGDVQTVTALHASGAFQDITVSGPTDGHPDHVAIRFLNDLYGGSADADRNVYVASIAIDGRTFAAAEATNTAGPTIEGVAYLWGSQGSLTFDTHTVDAPQLTNPIAVSIQVSEDAYLGDARFRVMVDGVQLGDIQTATAVRSGGKSQWIELAGLTVDDPHRLTVQFVNDAWGGAAALDRNLYVEALTVNGHAFDVLAADNTAGFVVDGAAGLLNDSGHLSFLLS